MFSYAKMIVSYFLTGRHNNNKIIWKGVVADDRAQACGDVIRLCERAS